MDSNDCVFILGKIRLNPNNDERVPLLEIVMDTASGRTEGEIILLKQIAKEDNTFYTDKLKK